MERVETIAERRKKELKRIEKKLQELLDYRNKKDYEHEDFTTSFRALPKLARTAIDNEIDALNRKRRYLQYDINTIIKDVNDALDNVFKYYGVEDKKQEIIDNFNRYEDEGDKFDRMVDRLAHKISKEVDWKSKEKDYMY